MTKRRKIIEQERMNHTRRIAHIARQRPALTKSLVRGAVDRYFEALAQDIASGEWIDLPGIGKIQVIQEEAKGVLISFERDSKHVKRRAAHRLRTRVGGMRVSRDGADSKAISGLSILGIIY